MIAFQTIIVFLRLNMQQLHYQDQCMSHFNFFFSFSEAKDMLAKTPMLAPAYFILGGTKSGEAAIITRSRDKAIDILE